MALMLLILVFFSVKFQVTCSHHLVTRVHLRRALSWRALWRLHLSHTITPQGSTQSYKTIQSRDSIWLWDLAYMISAIVFSVIAIVGFLTFGASSSGFILNNYSPYDPLVTASRAAVALSIVFTYPLPFVGFRDGILDVLQVEDRSEGLVTLMSVGLLLAVTVAAASITDLALVLSVGGGTFSTAVTSVFPALMFRAAVKDSTNPRDELDSMLALVFMFISSALGAIGVSIAIRDAIH